ncbi:MAG: hypothetical protein GF400_01590 [Candidatus Eisenbacteria bacterium]|nr:hypothetical protein [Candidatus Eisenbacteria bacterium]
MNSDATPDGLRGRLFTSALPAAALALAALAVAVIGSRSMEIDCRMVGGRVQGESVTREMKGSSPVLEYDLELASVSCTVHGSKWRVDGPETGPVALGGSTLSKGRDGVRPGAVFVGADAETLAFFRDRWFVAPECGPGARGKGWGAVLWAPEVRYTAASPHHRDDPRYLFAWNYSHDLKLLHRDYLRRSIGAAASGESLAVRSRLVVVRSDGTETPLAPVPTMYTADEGFSFERDGRGEIVIKADGSYQNADMLYLATNQPELGERGRLELRLTDDIGGNYRGIFCIDPTTGERLWDCRTGAGVSMIRSADLNEDPEEEYLMQCYGSENGVSGSGMTDAGCTYVFCVDRWGHMLWKRRLCGVFPGASVAVLDAAGDAEPEVAVGLSSTRHEHLGSLSLLTGWGEVLDTRSDLGGVHGVVPFDVDGDGRHEIAAGLPDSTVCAFDGALEPIRSYRDPEFVERESRSRLAPGIDLDTADPWSRRLTPLVSYDVDLDGEAELVLLSQAYWDDYWVPHERGTFYGDASHLVVLGGDFEEEARCVVKPDESFDFQPLVDPPASTKCDVALLERADEGWSGVTMASRHFFVFRVKERG